MSFFTKTTNGNVSVQTELRSLMLSLWMISQGSECSDIIRHYINAITDCLDQPESSERTSRIVHILTLILRLRDFRNGGHGRRKEFFPALLAVLEKIGDENITTAMLSVIVYHYGCWNDLNRIREYLDLVEPLKKDSPNKSSNPKSKISKYRAIYMEKMRSQNADKAVLHQYLTSQFIESTRKIIEKLFITQIKKEINGGELTMCSKYFPDEEKDIETALSYAKVLFPHIGEDIVCRERSVDENSPLSCRYHRLFKTLRKTLGPLRNQIPMIERALCGDMADRIDPSKIPGVALQRSRRALQNIASLGDNKGNVQRSENPRRIKCAQNLDDHVLAVQEAFTKNRKELDELKQKLLESTSEEEKLQLAAQITKVEEDFKENAPKVHGGDTVFVNDLVKQYKTLQNRDPTIEAQFMSMLGSLPSLTKMNILIVLDTSDSMSSGNYGVSPIEVAIGLTALCASNAPKTTRHKFMSFSSRPTIKDVSRENGGNPQLWDYIQFVRQNKIVSNTNIQSTINLIASISSSLPLEESFDMILFFSDMQFNKMVDLPNPQFKAGDYIKQEFGRIGRKVPLIAFWNLNAKYTDCPAEPSDDGVVMISGYSHTMLESFADTVIAASQVNLEEAKAQKALALAAFEEERQLERQRIQEEKDLNTFQLMLDFCEGKFSYPLKKEISKISSGIFESYSFEEPEQPEKQPDKKQAKKKLGNKYDKF